MVQNHGDWETLAASYTISALEPDENASFETHLADCGHCASYLAGLALVTAALPLSVDEVAVPPPGLRQRLLVAVREESDKTVPQPMQPHPHTSGWLRLFRGRVLIPAALGVLVLAIAGMAFWVQDISSRLDTSELRLSQSYLGVAILASAEQEWRFQGTGPATGASGFLAYSGQHQAACLILQSLPIGQDGIYHAWATNDGVIASLGEMWPLGQDMWLVIPSNVDQFDTISITLEQARGASQPVGPTVAMFPVTNN